MQNLNCKWFNRPL